MAGDIKPDRPKIKTGGAKVFLTWVAIAPGFFNLTGNAGTIKGGNVELFHGLKWKQR